MTTEELQKLLDAATKGPRAGDPADWYADWYDTAQNQCDIRAKGSEIVICEGVSAHNATLIALTPTLAAEVIALRARVAAAEKLAEAAASLRSAQKSYMADRGNNNLGAAVGARAAALDAALAAYEATK